MPTRARPLAPSCPMDLAREVGRLAGTVAVAFALLTLVAAHVSAQGENPPPVAVGDERGSVAEIHHLLTPALPLRAGPRLRRPRHLGDTTAVDSYETASVGLWQYRQHASAAPGCTP